MFFDKVLAIAAVFWRSWLHLGPLFWLSRVPWNGVFQLVSVHFLSRAVFPGLKGKQIDSHSIFVWLWRLLTAHLARERRLSLEPSSSRVRRTPQLDHQLGTGST